MSISRAELIDHLANMTVLELSQLIKELEEKFGVSGRGPHGDGGNRGPQRPRPPRWKRRRPSSTWS